MSFRHFRNCVAVAAVYFASAGHYAFCRMNLQRGWRSTRRPRSKFPETQMFTLCCTQICFFCFIPYLPNSWPDFSRPQDYYSNGGGKEEAAKKRSWHKRKGDEVLQISMDDLPFFFQGFQRNEYSDFLCLFVCRKRAWESNRFWSNSERCRRCQHSFSKRKIAPPSWEVFCSKFESLFKDMTLALPPFWIFEATYTDMRPFKFQRITWHSFLGFQDTLVFYFVCMQKVSMRKYKILVRFCYVQETRRQRRKKDRKKDRKVDQAVAPPSWEVFCNLGWCDALVRTLLCILQVLRWWRARRPMIFSCLFSGLHVNPLMFCAASIPIQREGFVTGMRWYHFKFGSTLRTRTGGLREGAILGTCQVLEENFVPHDATLTALNSIGLYDLAAFSMHIGSVSHGEILRYDGVIYGQSDESIFNLGWCDALVRSLLCILQVFRWWRAREALPLSLDFEGRNCHLEQNWVSERCHHRSHIPTRWRFLLPPSLIYSESGISCAATWCRRSLWGPQGLWASVWKKYSGSSESQSSQRY